MTCHPLQDQIDSASDDEDASDEEAEDEGEEGDDDDREDREATTDGKWVFMLNLRGGATKLCIEGSNWRMETKSLRDYARTIRAGRRASRQLAAGGRE